MSDDDIVSRSAEFDRKVAAAGSTNSIVGNLVKGAERSQRVVRWLAVSLALDIVLSLTLGMVGLVALNNSQAVEKQSQVSCERTSENSVVINKFLDLLIQNTKTSSQRTEAQKKAAIDGYEKLVIKIPDCR